MEIGVEYTICIIDLDGRPMDAPDHRYGKVTSMKILGVVVTGVDLSKILGG